MPYTPPPALCSLSLNDITKLAEARKLPPVNQWHPQNMSDSKMQILSDGRWFHDGGEIKRLAMIRAFSSLLRKDDDGHWLVTPYEKQSIIVEDAPFIAVEMHNINHGKDRQITMRLNNDEIIALNQNHHIVMQSKDTHLIPYIHIRHSLLAKLTRSVAYELYDIAIADTHLNDGAIGVWSGGTYFELGQP